MGRYPHLGAFELEGRDDLRDRARGAGRHRHARRSRTRPFPTLSGGEKQRVVIAGALAQAAGCCCSTSRPPRSTSATSSRSRRCSAGSTRERGVTMVVSTHDLNLAAGLCQRLVLLRDGRVLAAGPTDRGADARHRAGALRRRGRRAASTRRRPPAVVPLRRAGREGVSRVRCAGASSSTVAGASAPLAVAARACWRRWSGSTPISAAARVRPQHPVRRQRRRADLLRRAAAARAGRGARRRGARRGGRRVPGAAAQPARHAVHARRLGGRGARRDAGHHLPASRSLRRRCPRCRSPASPARSARSRSSTAWPPRGAAASRRTCCCWPASRSTRSSRR